jgi:hypothetical protein
MTKKKMDLILLLSKDEIDRVPRSELQRKKLNIKEKEVIENALKFRDRKSI